MCRFEVSTGWWWRWWCKYDDEKFELVNVRGGERNGKKVKRS